MFFGGGDFLFFLSSGGLVKIKLKWRFSSVARLVGEVWLRSVVDEKPRHQYGQKKTTGDIDT